jgi:hypothetical protein
MTGLDSNLAAEIRRTLEFHLWGSAAEGVTDGGTVYARRRPDIRRDVHKLQDLCRKVIESLGSNAPSQLENLMAAGSMYRRSADYVKAREYFLRLLEKACRGSRCA